MGEDGLREVCEEGVGGGGGEWRGGEGGVVCGFGGDGGEDTLRGGRGREGGELRGERGGGAEEGGYSLEGGEDMGGWGVHLVEVCAFVFSRSGAGFAGGV